MLLGKLNRTLQQNDHDNFLPTEHIPGTAVHESWLFCQCQWAKGLRLMETEGQNLTEFVLKSNVSTERLKELFVERFPGDPMTDEQLTAHIVGLEETIRDLKIEAQTAFRLRSERRKVVSDKEREDREKKDRAYVRDRNNDPRPPKTRQSHMDKVREKLIACGLDPDQFFKDTLGK